MREREREKLKERIKKSNLQRVFKCLYFYCKEIYLKGHYKTLIKETSNLHQRKIVFVRVTRFLKTEYLFQSEQRHWVMFTGPTRVIFWSLPKITKKKFSRARTFTTLFTGREVFTRWNLGTWSKRLQDFFSGSRRLYHIDTYDTIKFEIDQCTKSIIIKFHT